MRLLDRVTTRKRQISVIISCKENCNYRMVFPDFRSEDTAIKIVTFFVDKRVHFIAHTGCFRHFHLSASTNILEFSPHNIK